MNKFEDLGDLPAIPLVITLVIMFFVARIFFFPPEAPRGYARDSNGGIDWSNPANVVKHNMDRKEKQVETGFVPFHESGSFTFCFFAFYFISMFVISMIYFSGASTGNFIVDAAMSTPLGPFVILLYPAIISLFLLFAVGILRDHIFWGLFN